jgi:hypothetical protein
MTGATGADGALNAWGLTGNNGTTPSTNFIGTRDNADLVVKTNNTEKLRITAAGQISVGDGTVAGNNNICISLINNTGAVSVIGDIVIIGSVDNSFGVTNNPGHYAVVGIVTEAVAPGNIAKIAISGVVTVNLDGSAAVIRGQHCITGNANGKASGIAIPGAGSSVGIYLTNGSAGTTAKVLLK